MISPADAERAARVRRIMAESGLSPRAIRKPVLADGADSALPRLCRDIDHGAEYPMVAAVGKAARAAQLASLAERDRLIGYLAELDAVALVAAESSHPMAETARMMADKVRQAIHLHVEVDENQTWADAPSVEDVEREAS